MAFPVELLTTQAQCNDVLSDLQTELKDFTVRQTNYDYRDEKATDRAADLNQEALTLDRDIADLNRELAAMAADSKRRPRAEADLRAYVKRRGDLGARTSQNPVTAFRLAVDARQVAVQVPELQQAMAEVTAHRVTLAA
ncbi:hypothetical protein [Hymenobacter perfusus]|uniref:Uncharacterized protein n=1 Tax=Hymenobacter perfusus TaxID=1236770 RepID=A0A3R9MCN7_9BACT|nr:hypothetical protein [Hymenobacter perfusus]RSK42715.1 hypothetical protein EI293_13015 [Hymenobacter perfusus]